MGAMVPTAGSLSQNLRRFAIVLVPLLLLLVAWDRRVFLTGEAPSGLQAGTTQNSHGFPGASSIKEDTVDHADGEEAGDEEQQQSYDDGEVDRPADNGEEFEIAHASALPTQEVPSLSASVAAPSPAAAAGAHPVPPSSTGNPVNSGTSTMTPARSSLAPLPSLSPSASSPPSASGSPAALVGPSHSPTNSASSQPTPSETPGQPRDPEGGYRTGRMARSALWVRSFAGNEEVLTNVLLPSLRLFWPPRRFGRIYIVLDGGVNDFAMASRLLARFGGEELRSDEAGNLKVHQAMLPQEPFVPSTIILGARMLEGGASDADESGSGGRGLRGRDLAANATLFRAYPKARSHLNDPLLTITYCRTQGVPGFNGYHQQQWWTFHADVDVPEEPRFESPIDSGHGSPEPPTDVIGIADSDAIAHSPPHEHTFFDDEGRPVVIPRVGLPIGDLWAQSAKATEWILGLPEMARGMAFFPVYFKRAHFKGLRDHIEKLHGKPFAQVFAQMIGKGFYSQFNIMVAYAFHFHRSEYSWHWFVPDTENGAPMDREALKAHAVAGITHDFSFLDSEEETRHWPRTWTHWRHHRFRILVKQHLIRGFCWAVSDIGSHPLCDLPEHSFWNAAPVHHMLDLSSMDFEFAFRGGQGAIDAWRWHTRSVGNEVLEGKWAVHEMAQWLQQTVIPDVKT